MGEILRVPPGTYRGNFTISKSIVLIASHDAVLDGNGQGTVLRVSGEGVRVEGLIFEKSGSVIGNGDSSVVAENAPGFILKNCILRETLFGLQLLASPDALIEGNEMSSFLAYPVARRGDLVKVWYSPRVRIRNNHIHDGRDLLVWYSDHSFLEGNVVEKMRYALHYMYSHESLARQNTFKDSSVGIYNMYGNGAELDGNIITSNRGPSGYGVALKEASRIRLKNNRIIENRIGLQLDNSPVSPPVTASDATVFELNRIERNDFGVTFVGSGYGSAFLKNDFVENWQQVSTSGLQSGTTIWSGNYWSDYRGVDPSDSGTGIIAYTADSVADAITDRFEGFKLFNFGPAILALEFTQKLIPWVHSVPKAIDLKPSMQPRLEASGTVLPARERFGLALLSFAVLGSLFELYRRVSA